jgi:hypothetical protein
MVREQLVREYGEFEEDGTEGEFEEDGAEVDGAIGAEDVRRALEC